MRRNWLATNVAIRPRAAHAARGGPESSSRAPSRRRRKGAFGVGSRGDRSVFWMRNALRARREGPGSAPRVDCSSKSKRTGGRGGARVEQRCSARTSPARSPRTNDGGARGTGRRPLPSRSIGREEGRRGSGRARPCENSRNATWLILPVVICLSQRLSHACVSMNKFRL